MTRGKPFEIRHSFKTEWVLGASAGVVAVAALSVGKALGKITHSSAHQRVIGWSCAAVLLVSGFLAVRHLSRALGRLVSRQSSIGTGAALRLVSNGVGSLILIFAMFAVLGVSLSHLLIGAGLAGIILGIAAQQSLGNIFAAIVMLFARPFVVGDDIRIRSGNIGVIDVKVLGIGLTYVTVSTDDGVLKIPNSAMLAAGIGRPRAAVTPTSDAVSKAAEAPLPTPDEEDDPSGDTM